jgi:hypothetical protein
LSFKIKTNKACIATQVSELEETQVKKSKKYMNKNMKCNILVVGLKS